MQGTETLHKTFFRLSINLQVLLEVLLLISPGILDAISISTVGCETQVTLQAISDLERVLIKRV